MKLQEFLEELQDVIDTEMELEPSTLLEDIEEYDSIAVLSLMSFFDELGVDISAGEFEKFERVSDIIERVGDVVDG
jgi:acyl carrier protein